MTAKKTTISYRWTADNDAHVFSLAYVPGTDGAPFDFGGPEQQLRVNVADFFIGVVPVTQALWQHVVGSNPAVRRGALLPVENISWDHITQPAGFLQQLNESAVADYFRKQWPAHVGFRLPSETEWEYAARGGPHWRDGYVYSGGNHIESVAWYDRRHGDHTQPVGQKTPNQLGIYDMSGNVWEWCQDTYTADVRMIPIDGAPFAGAGDARVLRGGCFHNWAMHCTVSKRYEIARDFHDGCIGLRVVACFT